MRLAHRYGANVHLLDEVWARTAVARLSAKGAADSVFHDLLDRCFQRLFQGAAEHLPARDVAQETRMTALHPDVRLYTNVVDPHPVVLVDVARAGMLPAHAIQRELLLILDPELIRVDHVYMQRTAAATGRVTGVSTTGSKIGGSVAGSTLIVPDPMGATGTSVSALLDLYKANYGLPGRILLLHLIVTPEYLRRIATDHPEALVFALRLDRGLSPPEVLRAVPGERWDEERGLNAHDYIVPGAGGLGELINNCY
jgi:uracil phosphoribosyltransferase